MTLSSKGKRDFPMLVLSGERAGGGCLQFEGSIFSDSEAGGAINNFSTTDTQHS